MNNLSQEEKEKLHSILYLLDTIDEHGGMLAITSNQDDFIVAQLRFANLQEMKVILSTLNSMIVELKEN